MYPVACEKPMDLLSAPVRRARAKGSRHRHRIAWPHLADDVCLNRGSVSEVHGVFFEVVNAGLGYDLPLRHELDVSVRKGGTSHASVGTGLRSLPPKFPWS